jgi:hypothetical protein
MNDDTNKGPVEKLTLLNSKFIKKLHASKQHGMGIKTDTQINGTEYEVYDKLIVN